MIWIARQKDEPLIWTPPGSGLEVDSFEMTVQNNIRRMEQEAKLWADLQRWFSFSRPQLIPVAWEIDEAMARQKPKTEYTATVHICGPWEDAPPTDDGEPVVEQRCRRCDALISEADAPRAHEDEPSGGYEVGARVGLIDQPDTKLKRYVVGPRELSENEEDCT